MNEVDYILNQILKTELKELYGISKKIPKRDIIDQFNLDNELNPRVELLIKMISTKYNIDPFVLKDYLLKIALKKLIKN